MAYFDNLADFFCARRVYYQERSFGFGILGNIRGPIRTRMGLKVTFIGRHIAFANNSDAIRPSRLKGRTIDVMNWGNGRCQRSRRCRRWRERAISPNEEASHRCNDNYCLGSVDELSKETRLQPKVIEVVRPKLETGRFAISAKRRCSARSRANLCAVLSYNWVLKSFLSCAKNFDPCIFRLKVACRMHWTWGTWRDARFDVRERQNLMADIIGKTSQTRRV